MSAAAAEFISVGNGHFVNLSRVIAMGSTNNATVRRMLRQAEKEGHALDFSGQLKTMGVILMDTGLAIRVALRPRDIAETARIEKRIVMDNDSAI